MVAPTGVNEGLPGEPAKAGRAGAELAEPQAAEAETSGTETSETETAGAEMSGPADAASAGAAPAGTGSAEETGDWDAEEVSRDVSPLAVVGIILGVIALVGVAAGVLAVVTHGFRPKTVVTYRPAAVFGLRPGQ